MQDVCLEAYIMNCTLQQVFELKLLLLLLFFYHCSLMLCILYDMDATGIQQTCGMFPSHFSLL